MGSTETAPSDELKALEHFVVDNDDLLDIEQRIGRFNIFDALGIARVEIRHSNFLAWLLDPAESHGQGSLFLRAVLMDLLRDAPVERRALSPVELDGAELRGVEIRREWKHIDILITCDEPRFVIAIENKIDSGEHSDQLARYCKVVSEEFPGARRTLVFLTRDGFEPSEGEWVPYSYGDVHRVLQRCCQAYETSIGKDVLAFLRHYLRLIGSRFMENPEILTLCQRIYRNHRQALDLIFDTCGPSASPQVRDIAEMLRDAEDQWQVFNETSRRVDFVPKSWIGWLPPLGSLPKGDPRFWFHWRFDIVLDKQFCRILGIITPCHDLELRRKAIEKLAVVGIGKPGKMITDRWTTVYNKVVYRWKEGDEPDRDAFLAGAKKALDQLRPKLEGIPDVLQPILANA